MGEEWLQGTAAYCFSGKRPTGWCIQHLKCHLRLSARFKYFISQGEYEHEPSWSDIVSGDVWEAPGERWRAGSSTSGALCRGEAGETDKGRGVRPFGSRRSREIRICGFWRLLAMVLPFQEMVGRVHFRIWPVFGNFSEGRPKEPGFLSTSGVVLFSLAVRRVQRPLHPLLSKAACTNRLWSLKATASNPDSATYWKQCSLGQITVSLNSASLTVDRIMTKVYKSD